MHLQINTSTTKRSYSRWAIMASMLLMGLLGGRAQAQTTHVNPATDGGFELGATLPANGWTVVNPASNTWNVSGVAGPSAGANSAFISNTGGTTYAYTTTTSRTSHFYKDIAIPAGNSNIFLQFKYKQAGELNWDRLLVYAAPTTVTPVVNAPVSQTTTLTGASLLFVGVPTGGVYQSYSMNVPPSFAGTTMRLIFTWQNDGSGGTQPPASVDEIQLTSCAPGGSTSTPVTEDWSSAPSCSPWYVVNSTTNGWFRGSATGNASPSMYISNDGGVSNAYTTSTLATSHFYRDVTFLAGQNSINLSFQLKGSGESSFDRLLVYLAPTTVSPQANVPSSSSILLTGATLLYTQSAFFTNWTNVNVPITQAQAGNASANSTRRLIFTWQNDASLGTQSPAAIDNINLTAAAPTCAVPTGLSSSAITATSATISWTGILATTQYLWEIRTSGACGSGSPVQSGTTAGTSVNLTGLSPNTTYTYCVRSNACGGPTASAYASGTFTTPPVPPVNDLCANATVLIPGATCVPTAGTTLGATQSLANNCAGNPNDDVWYQFVATSTNMLVNVTGSSGFDAVIEIFNGNCTALTSGGCIDNGFSGDPENGMITNLTVGATYYFRVYHYGSGTPSTSTFTVCLVAPPSNDDCSNAIPITCGSTVTGDNTFATDDFLIGCSGADIGAGVWYTFVGTGQPTTFSTCSGTNFDTEISVYTGTCNGLTCLAGNDQFCGNQSRVTINTTCGTTYYVSVAGYYDLLFGQQYGSFTLTTTCACPTIGFTTTAANPGCNAPTSGSITVNTPTGGCAPYSYSIDNGASFQASNSFTGLAAGTYQVVVRHDASGCLSAAQSVTLTGGGSSPAITTCPSVAPVGNTVGQCGANVTYPAAVVTGSPAPVVTYSQASGSFFPVGTTAVTVTATNACGSVQCTFDVIVNDVEAPSISCPSNVSVPAASGTCAASVSYNAPVGNDNCAGATTVQTAGLASGASYGIGSTTNTFVVTDAAGLTGSCSFTVTVTDNQAPTISCPAGQTVCTAPGASTAVISFASATATDNCGAATVVQTAGPASGSAFPVGANTVTFTATDAAGNATSCSTTFTVNQTPAVTIGASGPTTFCGPGCVTLTANASSGPVTYLWSNGATTQSISACSTGTYTVTVTANGCSSSASQTVTVNTFSAGNVVFTETIGQVTGTTTIAAHETANGFDNDPYTMTGTGDIRNTLPSTGYLGATGGANVFLTNNTLSPRTFEISGINTLGFTGLTIACGVHKSTTTSNGSDLLVQVSANGTTYTTLAAIPMTTGTGTAVWSTRNYFGAIPATANLRIRFTNAGLTGTQYRVDDIVLVGFSNAAVASPAGPTTFCPGGSVQIGASLSSSYLWSTGETTQSIVATQPGTYQATLTSGNGCTAVTNPVTVSWFAVPSVTATATNVSCFGGNNGTATALPSGGTAPYSYVWNPGGQTTQTATGLSAGTYTVSVTDVNGCVGSTSVQWSENMGNVTNTTSIASHEAGNGFQNTAFTMNGNGDVRSTQTSAGGYTGASGGANVFLTDLGGAHDFQITGANSTGAGSFAVTFGVFKSTTGSNGSDLAVEVSADGVNYTALSFPALPTGSGTAVWTQRTATGFVPASANLRIRFRNNATLATQYRIDDVQFGNLGSQATVVVTQPTQLTASASATVRACGYNVSCNGGTDGQATVAANGGTAPYSYSWSNGASGATANGLAAGTYSVVVTDANGCTATATVTLTQPAQLVASATSPLHNGSNISCNGGNDGAINLTVGGGASCLAYSYAWSNGATTEDLSGLTAGTYSVTITDANGCSTTASITLTEPTALSGSLIAQSYNGYNISCNGGNDGMIFANIAGGTPAYSYAWSNGASSQMVTGLTAGTYSVTVTDANGCTYSQSITLVEPAPVVANATASTFACGTNVSCHGANDGSITLSVSGGTGNYAFSWSNGANTQNLSGLGAGTYSVTVSDQNGCSTTATLTLTEPALLQTSLTTSVFSCGYGVSCFGASNGSVTSATTGGCAPYSYAWSNSGIGGFINGVPAGTYSVTVTDANGCQAFATAEITQPAALVGSGVAATYGCGYNVTCNGATNGSIDYSVAGGCAPYTYLWSNGATSEDVSGLGAGTYTVVATDVNGCSTTSTFTLTEPAVLVGNGSAATYSCGYNVSCNGAANGSISYAVTGGCAPYSYAWSNGASTASVSGLTAGTYSVTTTDANGCSTSSSFTLTEPAVLVGSGVPSVANCGYSIACNGGTGSVNYSVSGGCAPYAYLWSNGATTEDLSGVGAGTYSVTATDANGCTTTSSFTLTQPGAITADCPTNTTVYVGWQPLSCATLAVTNVAGGCAPYTYNWSNGATTASTTVCPTVSTDYTVTITDANGCTKSCTVRVCVVDVRCGNNLQKITICHTPPGNTGNPQTLCVAPSAVLQHVPGHGGDYLGACGTNLPCAAPLKSDGGNEAGAAMEEIEGAELGAHPNPFSDVTTIDFMVMAEQEVRLTVYNLNGQAVGVVYDGLAEAGRHYDLDWKADGLSNGIYFAKLVTGNGEVKTLKLVLQR